MTTSNRTPKCRAKGGVKNCHPANCPEKKAARDAFLTDLTSAASNSDLLVRHGSRFTGEIADPDGCRHCGEPKKDHGTRYVLDAEDHRWVAPTNDQRKIRMLARSKNNSVSS